MKHGGWGGVSRDGARVRQLTTFAAHISFVALLVLVLLAIVLVIVLVLVLVLVLVVVVVILVIVVVLVLVNVIALVVGVTLTTLTIVAALFVITVTCLGPRVILVALVICRGFLPSQGLVPGAFRGCGVGFWGSTAAPQAVLSWDWGDGSSHSVGVFWGSNNDAAVLDTTGI